MGGLVTEEAGPRLVTTGPHDARLIDARKTIARQTLALVIVISLDGFIPPWPCPSRRRFHEGAYRTTGTVARMRRPSRKRIEFLPCPCDSSDLISYCPPRAPVNKNPLPRSPSVAVERSSQILHIVFLTMQIDENLSTRVRIETGIRRGRDRRTRRSASPCAIARLSCPSRTEPDCAQSNLCLRAGQCPRHARKGRAYAPPPPVRSRRRFFRPR